MSDYAVGFSCAFVAVFCFGSNFLPVKKYPTGDGFFFQWVMCSAIWMCGLVVQYARGFYLGSSPPFEPFAALGGLLWCTGNVAAAFVIQLIGMGLGLLLWGGSNSVVGWFIGYFGLLGVTADTLDIPALNIVGAMVTTSALIIMFFVDTSKGGKSDGLLDVSIDERLLMEGSVNLGDSDELSNSDLAIDKDHSKGGSPSWIDSLTPVQRRLVGCPLALLMGVFFGFNFNPPTYLMNSHRGGSQSALDYVFSHFCGIYGASTVYFIIYCIYKRNKPFMPNYLILPSFISGIGWAMAQIAWFVANENLGFAVAFPIITTMPGIVGMVWGVLLFKEVQGTKNFIVLGIAIITSISGITMITISKVG